MNILTKAGSAVKNLTGVNGLKIRKHAPEILIGVAFVMGVSAIVEACVSTRKLDDVIEEHVDQRNQIKEAAENNPEMTKQEENKQIAKLYAETAFELGKLYFPTFMLALGSGACVLSAHGVMKRRNLAIISAYNSLKLAYDGLNNRLVDELGEERAKELKYGVKREQVETVETNEKGKEVKKVTDEKTFSEYDPSKISPYAKFFDETCINTWKKDPDYNLMFLKAQQEYATNLLNARGFLFLNEVYEMLGMPMTKAGQAVGWLKGAGDNYVDFGIYDDATVPARRDFVNGRDRSILLDFNVDGVIWDKIGSFC